MLHLMKVAMLTATRSAFLFKAFGKCADVHAAGENDCFQPVRAGDRLQRQGGEAGETRTRKFK